MHERSQTKLVLVWTDHMRIAMAIPMWDTLAMTGEMIH